MQQQSTLDFADEGGFSHLVELCNGCGTCRQSSGGTMCPTYRASRDEIATTRGRANVLRAAISGDLPADEMYSERFQSEVLDLCVGCKGCANDCPTGVDLAKLKAEVKHQYHEHEGVSLRSKLFANVDALSRWGSRLAPLSNWATAVPGSRTLVERVVGIAGERELPEFRRESLVRWFDRRGPRVGPDADRRVLLFPDTYTNYATPEVGKAAVEVLEAAGVRVEIPDELAPSGRAAYSKGLLDVARERAQHNVEALAPSVADGWSVVFVEPSDAAMFQDEYADLVDGEDVLTVGANAFGVCEYLDTYRLDEEIDFAGGDRSLTYHGHCHQKALGKDHHAVRALWRAGYEVDPLDSGCCGMAGSFGYEAEHYDLSRAIGRILEEQIGESDGDIVVAPGTSCRTQLGQGADERPLHPVEALSAALES